MTRFEIDHDKRGCWELQIGVGDEVHIGRPQHTAFTSGSEQMFAQEEYNKLMWFKHWLNKATEAKSQTVVISEGGILNRVEIYRVIPVRQLSNEAKQATNANNGSLTKTASTPCPVTKDTKQGDKTLDDEYVVSFILCIVKRLEWMPYIVSWYEHSSQEGTEEQASDMCNIS